MTVLEINHYARCLFSAYGPNAMAIAAKKASRFEDQGEPGEARTWRRIEQTIAGLRS